MIARILGAVAILAAASISLFESMILNLAVGKAGEPPFAASLIAATAPMDGRPFRLAAAQAGTGAGTVRERLLVRALARDPREPFVRLELARHFLVTGRPSAAVAHLRLLQDIRPDLEPMTVALAAEAARVAVGRRAIATSFAGDAALLRIMASASAVGVDPDALLELLGSTLIAQIPGGLQQAQSILTRPLIEQGRLDQAYRLWRQLLSEQPSGVVFDGNFEGLEGAAPFNWTFSSNHTVQATPLGGGESGSRGLQVQVFGSDAVIAAEQLLVLGPGRYELRYEYRATATNSVPPLRWELRCRNGAFLVEDDLEAGHTRWGQGRADFEVANDCNAVRLVLRTTGHRLAGDAEILVRSVRVEPA